MSLDKLNLRDAMSYNSMGKFDASNDNVPILNVSDVSRRKDSEINPSFGDYVRENGFKFYGNIDSVNGIGNSFILPKDIAYRSIQDGSMLEVLVVRTLIRGIRDDFSVYTGNRFDDRELSVGNGRGIVMSDGEVPKIDFYDDSTVMRVGIIGSWVSSQKRFYVSSLENNPYDSVVRNRYNSLSRNLE